VTSSVAPGRERRAFLPRPRLERSWVLVGCTAASIPALATLKMTDGSGAIEHALQAVVVVTFVWLAATDLRMAVGLTIFEIALLGAGGQWTSFPGGISGRNFLTGVVVARAAIDITRGYRRTGKLELGRYGPHALGLAVVLAAIWMPVGLLRHNGAHNVFADGDGVLFLAFALPVIVLIQQGAARWLRHCLLAASAANAVVTAGFLLVGIIGLAPFRGSFWDNLLNTLEYGGAVGWLPEGSYRLYLGSGLYLQVGLALATWYLLRQPRNPWLWALYALLWVDVGASYTRGFWIGSVLTVALVVALGRPEGGVPHSRILALAAVLPAAGLALVGIGFADGSALLNRATTIGSPSRHRGTTAEEFQAVASGAESAAALSDKIRSEQAKVLFRHIKKHPISGSGFGAVARDYRYAKNYGYELSYMHIAYKTGLIGLILFMSFPLRLLWDAVRLRRGRLRGAAGVTPRAAAVPLAILVSLLLLGATNPYLLAAFGLCPIILTLAWLEPQRSETAPA
jgi:O-antigen ligase/polysaccharide polymerase Wzy-like membrane protein